MSDINLFNLLQIDSFSSSPKYLQIANSVIEGIRTKKLKKGDVLPSINELSFENYISRITVEKSYNYLKSKGIIASVRGKGFYIDVDNLTFDLRVFLLFNKLFDVYNYYIKLLRPLCKGYIFIILEFYVYIINLLTLLLFYY